MGNDWRKQKLINLLRTLGNDENDICIRMFIKLPPFDARE